MAGMKLIRHALLVALCCALPHPANAVERDRFNTAEGILEECQTPFTFEPDRKTAAALKSGADDLTSIPQMDCIAVLFDDGRNTLLTYGRPESNDYFAVREQSWTQSKDRVFLGKTPIHRMMNGGNSSHIRHRFDFGDASTFPINRLIDVAFARIDANGRVRPQRLFHAEVFAFERKGKTVERLHILIQDYGERPVDGGVRLPTRGWHIYSERANAIVLSTLPASQPFWDNYGLPGKGDVQVVAYIDKGTFVLVLNRDELEPLRNYFATFNPWNFE